MNKNIRRFCEEQMSEEWLAEKINTLECGDEWAYSDKELVEILNEDLDFNFEVEDADDLRRLAEKHQ